MKILYAIVGYGEEHLGYEMHRELAQAIIARGHSYTILALAHAKHMRHRQALAIEDGIPIYRVICAGRKHLDAINRIATPLFKFPWFLTSLWRIGMFLRAHHDYDLIIAESAFPMGGMIYLATRLVRLPYIEYVNGADFIANPAANYGYARFAFARALARAGYRAARLVRAESPYGARMAIELGCPPEKMTLVQRNIGECCFLPRAVDVENFRRAAREKIRARFNLNAPNLIVTVGRLLPIKGFDDLIRALPQIIARAGDTQILLLGPNRNDTKFGNYQTYLEKLARELNVADRITFAGPVPYDAVREFLAAADVVAVPSVQDSGNKLVMEAAAVATPFVSTWTAGNAQWAPEWNCGIIVDPRSPEQLANALTPVLTHREMARQMGANGLKFAEQFSASQVAERTIALCQAALEPAPLPQELRELNSLLHPVQI